MREWFGTILSGIQMRDRNCGARPASSGMPSH